MIPPQIDRGETSRFSRVDFVSLHKTLKVTPAMAAGVESRLWEIDDIVNVVEEWERANETA